MRDTLSTLISTLYFSREDWDEICAPFLPEHRVHTVTATHCIILQHTATYCSTLQHAPFLPDQCVHTVSHMPLPPSNTHTHTHTHTDTYTH